MKGWEWGCHISLSSIVLDIGCGTCIVVSVFQTEKLENVYSFPF